jgi:hypothetical protein
MRRAFARLVGMSFEDLPADWPRRPVTDPEITADLLDLIVGDQDRAVGALGILLCSRDERLLQPVVVEAPDLRASAAERRQGFDKLCAAFCHLSEPGADSGDSGLGMLVALARPGPVAATPGDLRWRDTAVRSCLDYGVALLGVWLVTPEVIRPLPLRASQRRSA